MQNHTNKFAYVGKSLYLVRVFGACCRFVVKSLSYLVGSLIRMLRVGTRQIIRRLTEEKYHLFIAIKIKLRYIEL